MPINPLIANPQNHVGNALGWIADQNLAQQRNALVADRTAQDARQFDVIRQDRQNALAAQTEEQQEAERAAMLAPLLAQGDPQAYAAFLQEADDPRLTAMFGDKAPEEAGPLLAQVMANQYGFQLPPKAPGPIEFKPTPWGGQYAEQDGQRVPGLEYNPPVPQQYGPESFSPQTLDDGSISLIGNRGTIRQTPLRGPQKGPDREKQKTEIQLAGTFANQSKDMNTVSGQYRRVLEVAKKPSPANDFALIYAFAKIQDPTSVVRESEFAQAAKTGAYGDQVQAAIGRVVNGKTLTDAQRADFITAASNAYEAQRMQWESSVVAPARQQAEAYGLEWKNIFKDYTVKDQYDERGERTTPANRVPRTEAPPAAIEYLKAHPETKAAFFKKYGYLP